MGIFNSLLYLYFSQAFLLIEHFYSSSTDWKLLEIISASLTKSFADNIELKLQFIDLYSQQLEYSDSPQIILDLTSSISLSNFLRQFCNLRNILLISMRDIGNSYNDWEFSTHMLEKDHLRTINGLISYLNWKKFILILNEYGDENDLMMYFPDKKITFYRFSSQNQWAADNFIGKEIKPTGIKNIVILNRAENAKILLEGLKNKNIFRLGCGVIMGCQSIWGINENGILGYAESGLENAVDYYSYESSALIQFFNIIFAYPNYYDSLALREYLEKNTVNHHQKPLFSIINIKNSQKIIIGQSTDTNFTIYEKDLNFPGNSSSIPNYPISYINIWMADGNTNPGYPDSAYTLLKQGAKYALQYIKATHFLEGFEILVTHTDCGADVYDPIYSINCFRELKNVPGVGFLTTSFPLTVIGNIISMRILNITIPHISEYSPLGILANKTNFPEFMRMARDDLYNARVLIDLILLFDWKNIILIYENSSDNLLIYQYFAAKAEEYNINIVNSNRMIKENYNHSDYPEYKIWMQNIISLKTRPFILFITPPAEFYLIEDFYDVGLTRKNSVLLFPNKVGFGIDVEANLSQKAKLIELLYGAISINEAEWIWEYGKKMKEGFIKAYSDVTDWRCLSFDAAMLLLNGIKYTIIQGENLEESKILNINLRKQNFLGCSGVVSIEPDSNDRSAAIIGIYNIIWNERAQYYNEFMVGVYDRGSTNLISFTSHIKWSDNTTNTPKDIITYENNCPFDINEAVYSAKSAGILYAISIGILTITAVLTFFIWKKWWKKEIEELSMRSLIQFEDYLAMAIVFIDFLQILGMGPYMGNYDSLVSYFTKFAIADFSLVTERETFWIYFYSALIAVFIWVFFSIENIFNFGKDTQNFFLVLFRILSKMALPVLGNACFLPISSILFSIFQCNKQRSLNINKAFLQNDCTTVCWENSHIQWAILSAVSLIIYLPLAIYLRPFWYISYSCINIKAQPRFLMIKSLFQISIIILSKTLKIYNQSLHGLILIILLFGLVLLCIKKKPYNYSRMNLWLIISYIAIIWSITLSSLYWIVSSRINQLWLAFQYIGWALIIITGFHIQWKHCPSMLFREKMTDIGTLFRFSLGGSIAAAEINDKNKERAKAKHLFLEIITEKPNTSAVRNESFYPIYEEGIKYP